MKTLVLALALTLSTVALAEEVKTECAQMNQNREKNLKLVSSKSAAKTKTSKQQ